MHGGNTLGISLNTRMLALAVISPHFSLVHYSNKLYKQKWSPFKSSVILSSVASCLRDYNIGSVVLSSPTKSYQTKELNTLYQSIKRVSHEYKITITEISKKSLRSICPEGEKKNKKTQMQTVVRFFDELVPLYQKEMRNKNKYYEKLFEAVGSVLVASVE